jgi:hypothetical protein
MMKNVIRCSLFIITIVFVVLLVGCKSDEKKIKKVKDLDFTVVEESDIPDELKTIIDEKKQQEFKLSYSDKEYKYIVVGYGEQKSGGYSISVDDLYLTDNAIYIDTNLEGPAKDAKVTPAHTYPYVVVKIEFIDKSVVFN